MKIKLLVLFLGCFSVSHAQAQLTARVFVGQRAILPYEPVSVLCRLGNETDQPLRVQRLYIQGDEDRLFMWLRVAIWQGPERNFEMFSDDVLGYGSSPPPFGPLPERIFAPSEFSYSHAMLGADSQGEHPFARPGILSGYHWR